MDSKKDVPLNRSRSLLAVGIATALGATGCRPPVYTMFGDDHRCLAVGGPSPPRGVPCLISDADHLFTVAAEDENQYWRAIVNNGARVAERVGAPYFAFRPDGTDPASVDALTLSPVGTPVGPDGRLTVRLVLLRGIPIGADGWAIPVYTTSVEIQWDPGTTRPGG